MRKNNQSINVVGLSGKAGSGKDYIAKHYFFPLGYRQISLAWHFKVWAVGKSEFSWDDVFINKPSDVRDYLQQEGTERGRHVYGENVWVDTIFAWIETLAHYWNEYNFIIPDVRFPNEVEGIQAHGGSVYRIVAPDRVRDAPLSDEAKNHPSETSLDNYSLENYNGIIYNDYDDMITLDSQINELHIMYNSPNPKEDPLWNMGVER